MRPEWAAEQQAPEAPVALQLRIARAKAVRPCANLACPRLIANPTLRGKRCGKCMAGSTAAQTARCRTSQPAATVPPAARDWRREQCKQW